MIQNMGKQVAALDKKKTASLNEDFWLLKDELIW